VEALSLVRTDDLDLAQRCAKGDRVAQKDLFDREKRRVHATIYRMLGSNSGIDDLIQDAFLQVFRSLPNFRGESSLATWIDRCTVRVVYAYFATKRRQGPVLELVEDIASGDATAEQRVMARDAARHLFAVLDTLEAKQRIAFSLHALDGHPLKEVSEIMDATLIATKTRVWRARKTIEEAARKNPALQTFLLEES
jgi:RNA polymerase sigma-70 factor, ECF subfamily